MAQGRKRTTARSDSAEQEIRQQEVLRANRELAAYFKGKRTEREAKAALKIIKAFIRDREHLDPAVRRPLPGVAAAKTATTERPRKKSGAAARDRRAAGRKRVAKAAAQHPVAAVAENQPPSTQGDDQTSV